MTKLEAVNDLLAAIGSYRVTALDTDGTSDAADAERLLDRFSRDIQAEGWHVNTEIRGSDGAAGVLLNVPTTTLTVSSVSGAFTAGETVTGDSSGAYGTFHQTSGTTMYLSDVSGTFTTDDSLTGGTSGETADVDAVSTVSEAEIVLAADILAVDSTGADAWRDITVRDGKLYDRDNNTADFSEGVRVALLRELDFTALPVTLQKYITTAAAVRFNYNQTRNMERDAFLRDERRDAMAKAVGEDDRRDNRTLLSTRPGAAILGRSWARVDTR